MLCPHFRLRTQQSTLPLLVTQMPHFQGARLELPHCHQPPIKVHPNPSLSPLGGSPLHPSLCQAPGMVAHSLAVASSVRTAPRVPIWCSHCHSCRWRARAGRGKPPAQPRLHNTPQIWPRESYASGTGFPPNRRAWSAEGEPRGMHGETVSPSLVCRLAWGLAVTECYAPSILSFSVPLLKATGPA